MIAQICKRIILLNQKTVQRLMKELGFGPPYQEAESEVDYRCDRVQFVIALHRRALHDPLCFQHGGDSLLVRLIQGNPKGNPSLPQRLLYKDIKRHREIHPKLCKEGVGLCFQPGIHVDTDVGSISTSVQFMSIVYAIGTKNTILCTKILHFLCTAPLILFSSPIIPKQNRSHGSNVICDGSPSRIRIVRRISLGMTTRPRSSILRTIPVAFIFKTPFLCCRFPLCLAKDSIRNIFPTIPQDSWGCLEIAGALPLSFSSRLLRGEF